VNREASPDHLLTQPRCGAFIQTIDMSGET
jgi:hypothetical protein